MKRLSAIIARAIFIEIDLIDAIEKLTLQFDPEIEYRKINLQRNKEECLNTFNNYIKKYKKHEDKLKKMYEEIIGLCSANYYTGMWDMTRFQLCKKDFGEFSDIDKALLYRTEKMSRSNVEKRAIHRNAIEDLFGDK